MSLTDIMSAMRLSFWPEVALVLFLVAFLGIVLSTFSKKNRAIYEAARQLPLEPEFLGREQGRDEQGAEAGRRERFRSETSRPALPVEQGADRDE